jgi:hypothetical protein
VKGFIVPLDEEATDVTEQQQHELTEVSLICLFVCLFEYWIDCCCCV